jgi:hypothetical protein
MATIEHAEKKIILARHGRRLLSLLDDYPVIPGDQRPSYKYANQARQILNDAEDDLKDWEPEFEIDSSQANLESNGMSCSTSQLQKMINGSVLGNESMLHQDQAYEDISHAGGRKISSETSMTTSPAYISEAKCISPCETENPDAPRTVT